MVHIKCNIPLLLLFFFFFHGSYYVALASIDLPMWTGLTLNSQKSVCLCLQSAEVKGACYEA